MVFDLKSTSKIVSKNFPSFKIGSSAIQYVTHFKYLGHIISNSINDDEDIQREIRNMFVRTNILIRRFQNVHLVQRQFYLSHTVFECIVAPPPVQSSFPCLPPTATV